MNVDGLRAIRVGHIGVQALSAAVALLVAVEHVAARWRVKVGVQVTRCLAPCENNAQLTVLHGGGYGVRAPG